MTSAGPMRRSSPITAAGSVSSTGWAIPAGAGEVRTVTCTSAPAGARAARVPPSSPPPPVMRTRKRLQGEGGEDALLLLALDQRLELDVGLQPAPLELLAEELVELEDARGVAHLDAYAHRLD